LLGLRFGWVYGPGRIHGWNEIQRVIEGFAFEQPVVPYPNYAAANDWTYVDDAARVIMACLNSPRASVIAYNVSGDYRTIHEAVAYLSRRFPRVRAEPYAATLPPAFWEFRSDRLLREVGVKPTTGLEDGLDRTVELLQKSVRSN
jgi:nucleoside-diphosphate-sugar epimerase